MVSSLELGTSEEAKKLVPSLEVSTLSIFRLLLLSLLYVFPQNLQSFLNTKPDFFLIL